MNLVLFSISAAYCRPMRISESVEYQFPMPRPPISRFPTALTSSMLPGLTFSNWLPGSTSTTGVGAAAADFVSFALSLPLGAPQGFLCVSGSSTQPFVEIVASAAGLSLTAGVESVVPELAAGCVPFVSGGVWLHPEQVKASGKASKAPAIATCERIRSNLTITDASLRPHPPEPGYSSTSLDDSMRSLVLELRPDFDPADKCFPDRIDFDQSSILIPEIAIREISLPIRPAIPNASCLRCQGRP